jgi:hypothetical protein
MAGDGRSTKKAASKIARTGSFDVIRFMVASPALRPVSTFSCCCFFLCLSLSRKGLSWFLLASWSLLRFWSDLLENGLPGSCFYWGAAGQEPCSHFRCVVGDSESAASQASHILAGELGLRVSLGLGRKTGNWIKRNAAPSDTEFVSHGGRIRPTRKLMPFSELRPREPGSRRVLLPIIFTLTS